MTAILVVEDDAHMAEGLCYNLERAGYEVEHAADGPTGLGAATSNRHDLVILDLMLPGMHGFDLLGQLRDAGVDTPVIILSAKGDEVDKIRGFETGADDYMEKPFGVGELLARIKARLGQRSPARDRVALGGGELRLDRLEFERDGDRQSLTPTEVDILRLLLADAGKPVAREKLLRQLWGLSRGSSRTLDTHVTRLRKKLETDPSAPVHLLTVHGVGYRLEL